MALGTIPFYVCFPLLLCYASINADSCSHADCFEDKDINTLLQSRVSVTSHLGNEYEQEVAELPAAAFAEHADANTLVTSDRSADAAKAAASAANTAAEAAQVAMLAASTAATAAADASSAATSAVTTLNGDPHSGANLAVASEVAVKAFAADGIAKQLVWGGSINKHIFSGLTFAMLIKALCVIGNVLVHVSPLPQVKSWDIRGCPGQTDPAPYVSIAFAGFQWCFYGLLSWWLSGQTKFLILVQSNCLGVILGTYYVKSFYCNCCDEMSLSKLHKYLSVIASLVLIQVCAMCLVPFDRALVLTGVVASCGSFMGAAAMIAAVPAVIRNKNSSPILRPYVLANLVSALLWSACGCMLKDPMVIIPNVFSALSSVGALCLKAMYPDNLFLDSEGIVPVKKVDTSDIIVPKKFYVKELPKTCELKGSSESELPEIDDAASCQDNEETYYQLKDDAHKEQVIAAVNGMEKAADGTGGTY
jgi:hypothetical protein